MEQLFFDNKYTKMYFQIIQKAKDRLIYDGYYEKHHIIPKSLNGNNDNDNIIKLTAKEHFIVHWLLTKMCISESHTRKMKYAMRSMSWNKTGNRIISAWQYELARKKVSESAKGRNVTDLTRKKLSIAGKKRFQNEENRKKMSISISNSPLSKPTDETKLKISNTMKEFYKGEENRKTMSIRIKAIQSTPEFRKKRSDLAKKRFDDRPELREIISKQFKGIPKVKIACPYCLKQIAPHVAKRWHFDNCKLKC
jgi:hypothetical protein